MMRRTFVDWKASGQQGSRSAPDAKERVTFRALVHDEAAADAVRTGTQLRSCVNAGESPEVLVRGEEVAVVAERGKAHPVRVGLHVLSVVPGASGQRLHTGNTWSQRQSISRSDKRSVPRSGAGPAAKGTHVVSDLVLAVEHERLVLEDGVVAGGDGAGVDSLWVCALEAEEDGLGCMMALALQSASVEARCR
jgi:hypothetical protein